MVFGSLISKNCKLKQLKKNKKNIFTVFSLKKETIEEGDTVIFDIEILIKLPENTNAFLATKFEGQEIQKIIGPTNGKKRLWITLLNESYFKKYQINKEDVIGYFIIKPENIKVHYATKDKTSSKKTKPPNNYLPKDWSKQWKSYFEKKKSLVFKQEVFSTVMTSPMLVEM